MMILKNSVKIPKHSSMILKDCSGGGGRGREAGGKRNEQIEGKMVPQIDLQSVCDAIWGAGER